MANQRPSYLKRQKEQARKAKAERKREERSARRSGAGANAGAEIGVQDGPAMDIETSADSPESTEPLETNPIEP
jgi:hypothetical protein